METVYASEPVMHNGEVYAPGAAIECDINDAAALISSGRGTQEPAKAAVAKKTYAAAQKDAAAAA